MNIYSNIAKPLKYISTFMYYSHPLFRTVIASVFMRVLGVDLGGKKMTVIVVFACTITGYVLYALTLSVTIIIVAVPEGLPMMITLVLSSNMKRMLKENVLVRKMVGIETSGSLNILFTDKTGTITTGKLNVDKILLTFSDNK
mgnify:CR=1 FL=1